MRKLNLAIFLFILICSDVIAQNALYVSPNGNDHLSGSLLNPLQTIDSALVISRKQHIHTIYLRKGTYYNVNLKITKADSNLLISGYKKEQAVLYGGMPFTSFEKKDGLLIISLLQKKGATDFQMILVNGSWRQRSRLPRSGSYRCLNEFKVKMVPLASGGGLERKPTTEELSQLKYMPADIAQWKKDVKNAEISLLNQWSESYAGVDAVDTIAQVIKLNYPLIAPPGSLGHKEYVVWNTREGLTQGGQWYWDKLLNKIFYRELPGETVQEIIVPTQRNIITFEKGAEKVRLKGFSLCAAANKLQNENFACSGIDPAIEGSQLRNISLEELSILQTNGSAIRLQGNNINVTGLHIRNCGGGGIYINGKNITITNCVIDSMGKIFKGATGIQGSAQKVLITNCTISNTPYSGICLAIDSGVIRDCIIKHAMTDLLDGGAIYGNSHHTSVLHNYIVGNNDNRFTTGIYFDELSNDCSAQNNIVVNTGVPIHINIANSIIYSNNIFVDKQTQTINSGGSSAVLLDGNIFVAPKIQFNGPSVFDKQIDTLKLEPKNRKSANPTGITSFQNNCLFSMSADNVKLPRTDKKALSGTIVKNINAKNMSATILNLLNDKEVIRCINNSKLGLTSKKLEEIELLIR